jgi:hypothetical protein
MPMQASNQTDLYYCQLRADFPQGHVGDGSIAATLRSRMGSMQVPQLTGNAVCVQWGA